MRVDDFDSRPVLGSLRSPAMWDLLERCVHAGKGRSVAYAKQKLGRQDFVWTGGTRHWIWVRPFTFQTQIGPVTLRWRAFVSKRGLVLEFEDTFGRYNSVKVAQAALQDFAKVWLNQ